MAKKTESLRTLFVRRTTEGIEEIVAVFPDIAVMDKLSCFDASGWNTMSEAEMLSYPQVQLAAHYQDRLLALVNAGVSDIEVIIPDRRKEVLADARTKRKVIVA